MAELKKPDIDLDNIDMDDPLGEDTVPEDSSTESKVLPEGFNPADYGLMTSDDLTVKLGEQKTEFDSQLENANKRVADTQTAYHDLSTNMTTRIANMEQKITHQPQQFAQSQAQSSDSYLAQYQQNQSMDTWGKYQQALQIEGNEKLMQNSINPLIEKQNAQFDQMRQQNAMSQEVAMFNADPSNKGVDANNVIRAFDPTQGGVAPSLSEGAVLMSVRQAGGKLGYEQMLKNQGATEMIAKLKGKGAPMKGLPSNLQQNRPLVDEVSADTWNAMSDDAVDLAAKQLMEQGVL